MKQGLGFNLWKCYILHVIQCDILSLEVLLTDINGQWKSSE